MLKDADYSALPVEKALLADSAPAGIEIGVAFACSSQAVAGLRSELALEA